MRQEFTRKKRAEVFLRAKGSCEKCGVRLKVGEGEVDHILPCALGGGAVIENAQLLCGICHKEKTADDVRRVRKSQRIRDKHSGAWKKKIKWPLQGKLKKCLDGRVIDRKTGKEV